MDPNRLRYFADDVRIHVLIVMFPPLIWNHTTHVGQPFVPELRIPSKGTSNTSHLLSPWPLAAACSLFQDIQWWIPITFLTHFAIQSGPTRKTTHEPNMYINTFTWTPVLSDWVSFVHLLLAPIPIWKVDVTITSDRYRQDIAFGWGHILVTWQADIFHSYMGRYQWPVERQGSLFPINNCSSRSSSLS